MRLFDLTVISSLSEEEEGEHQFHDKESMLVKSATARELKLYHDIMFCVFVLKSRLVQTKTLGICAAT